METVPVKGKFVVTVIVHDPREKFDARATVHDPKGRLAMATGHVPTGHPVMANAVHWVIGHQAIVPSANAVLTSPAPSFATPRSRRANRPN